jgi:hypothetical protein
MSTPTRLRLSVVAAVIAVLALAVPAHGLDVRPPGVASRQVADESIVSVYFLRDEEIATGEARTAEPPAVLEGALSALLAGPTGFEQGLGMGSEIPAGTELLGVQVIDGVAFVDLSGAFESGGGSLSMTARLAQVVYTATQFPTVEGVRILLDGALADTLGGEGLVIDAPVARSAFEFGGEFDTLAPQILPEEPRPGATVTSPLRVHGSSNTFEAMLALEIVALGGQTIVPQTNVMATSGTGTRGTFDVTLSFDAQPEGPATLRLFELSARDGSRVNVVEVPLTIEGPEHVTAFGDAQFFGSTADLVLNRPLVGMAATPTDGGYWLVAGDGGIFSYGDAQFHGSTGDIALNEPIVNIAADRLGRGYWTVASDGGVFAFDVPFLGSMGGVPLNQPVLGMAPTVTGDGYWMVAADGGIFSFGDAAFAGSTGGMSLNEPVVAMAADPDGAGYWLVAADGGVFSFDAPFHGSATGRIAAGDRAVAIAPDPGGGGYWIATRRGEVLSFGGASAGLGEALGVRLDTIAIAPTSTGDGYWLAHTFAMPDPTSVDAGDAGSG